MELIAALALLVLWENTVWVPSDGVLFTSLGGHRATLAGPGYRLAWPWPASDALVLGRVPFCAHGAALLTDAALRGRAARVGRRVRRLEIADIGGSVADGHQIRAVETSWLSATSHSQARAWTLAMRRIAEGGSLAAEIAASLDSANYVERFAALRRTTRLLRWTCCASVVTVFGVIPGASLWLGSETALLAAGPLALALHALAALLLARCYRSPEARPADWGTRYFSAVLLPPSMWREPARIVSDGLCGFDPLCAAAHLDAPERAHVLRSALGEVAYSERWRRRCEGAVRATAEARQQAIAGLAAFLEVDGEALSGPPASHPPAPRYCPVCQDAFRDGFGCCPGCEAPTLPWVPSAAD